MSINVNGVGDRVGTAAEWAASTLVLAAGERGVASDTGETKVGDGTNVWSGLTSEGREGKTTLVAGTKTVTDSSITAKTIIQLTAQSLGTVTAPKPLAVTARVVGTSFTITSSDATDTSVVGYSLVEGP